MYSATLTLPPSCSKVLASVPKPKGKNQKRKRDDSNKSDADVVEGAIAEILERAGAIGETKVVNLSTFNDSGNNGTTTNPNQRSIQLPPGLSLWLGWLGCSENSSYGTADRGYS